MTSSKPVIPVGDRRTGLLEMWSGVWSRRRLVGVGSLLIFGGICAAAAEERAGVNSTAIPFHIPAQPLATALQAYAERTGVQVLYESRSAEGRRSAAVEGSFTPEEALNKMLAGTEVRVRYTRPDAVTLATGTAQREEPPPTPLAEADLSLGTLRVRAGRDDENKGDLHDYSESVQSDVQKALQRNAKTRGGSYRVVVDLWIDPSRMVERARLHQSTGDPDRDAAVAAALHGLSISKPAPTNMPQPVRIAIVVRSVQ